MQGDDEKARGRELKFTHTLYSAGAFQLSPYHHHVLLIHLSLDFFVPLLVLPSFEYLSVLNIFKILMGFLGIFCFFYL